MQAVRLKRHVIRATIILMGMALIAGCAATQVPLDKSSLEQSKRIGVFIWHGRPSYNPSSGTGTIGAGATIGSILYSSISGESQRTMREIYESGVYETFEKHIVQELSRKIPIKLEILSQSNYVYEGSGTKKVVDVLASAKAQGYDVVLEAFVWPSLDERQVGVSQRHFETSLQIELNVKRIPDEKVLWKVSYKTSQGAQPRYSPDDFRVLAQKAANTAVSLYMTGQP